MSDEEENDFQRMAREITRLENENGRLNLALARANDDLSTLRDAVRVVTVELHKLTKLV